MKNYKCIVQQWLLINHKEVKIVGIDVWNSSHDNI